MRFKFHLTFETNPRLHTKNLLISLSLTNLVFMNLKPYLLIACLVIVYSCSSDDADELYLGQEDCKISQGISPNQDGFNDNFDLSCVADRTPITTLEIFDRNGRLIYKKENYRDEFIGQNASGSDVVTGTYFYVISFDAQDPEFGMSKEGSLYINVEHTN